jgi:riboflavin synthase
LRIEADFFMDQTKIGDSIAVNGACLTAVRVSGKHFDVDVSPETLQTTTLGGTRIGTRVNLERALRLSDRLDGHLVSGHIDGIGTLTHRKTTGNAIFIGFSVSAALARYMIKKGSIAVDGVSLTINRCDAHGFEVCIIPHTAQLTTVGQKKTGQKVNIETDIIGKYVERLFISGKDNDGPKKKAPIDMQFLAKTGFL